MKQNSNTTTKTLILPSSNLKVRLNSRLLGPLPHRIVTKKNPPTQDIATQVTHIVLYDQAIKQCTYVNNLEAVIQTETAN